MFAQAFPPGAQLLPVTPPAGHVKVWATHGADGRHTGRPDQQADPHAGAASSSQLPGGQSRLTVSALPRRSLTAVSGVTLGGQTFGAKDDDRHAPGQLRRRRRCRLQDGTYSCRGAAGAARRS